MTVIQVADRRAQTAAQRRSGSTNTSNDTQGQLNNNVVALFASHFGVKTLYVLSCAEPLHHELGNGIWHPVHLVF